MKIYLDDVRQTPPGWVRAKTAQECIDLLIYHQGKVEALSLDHDLGACDDCMQGKTMEQWFIENGNGQRMPNCEHFGTGYTVVLWLEEQCYNDPSYPLPKMITVHSANPVGRERMLSALRSIWSRRQ